MQGVTGLLIKVGTRAVLDEVGGLLDGSMVETVEDFMITPLVYRLKNSMSCQERQPRKMTCDERWVRGFVEGKKKKRHGQVVDIFWDQVWTAYRFVIGAYHRSLCTTVLIDASRM